MLYKSLLVALLLTATAAADQRFLIESTHNIGPIKKFSARPDFDQLGMAPGELKDGKNLAGELITEFYPNDSEKHLTVVWFDEKRTRVKTVLVDGPIWKTAQGVGVGLTMRKLQALNRRPFSFYAFFPGQGAGLVCDWHAGPLRENLANLDITLSAKGPRYDELSAGEKQTAGEEGQFASDSPLAQKLNPVISKIQMYFPDI